MRKQQRFSNLPFHMHDSDIISDPPSGKKVIFNLWWDPDTNEIVVEHD